MGAVASRQATATWYAIVGGNDTYWRVESPARAVGGQATILPEESAHMRGPDGRFRREPSAYYSITQENDDSLFPWKVYADRNDPDYMEVRYPRHQGAAIWTRPDLLRAKHAFAMQAQGIRTLSEVDDNYLSDPKFNVFQRSMGYGPAQRLEHMRATAFMSGIVVSTHWLRDHYYKILKRELGLAMVPDIFVCGNHVAEEDWPEPVPRTGPLRVGWMGSPAHVWDVDLAWPALMHARNLGLETWIVGYDPSNPAGSMELPPDFVANDRALRKEAQWRKVGFKHIPWRKPGRYERFALPFDIGLCPLLRNTNTLGKSDVKFLEYTIAGAATIAMNVEVYSRTIVHGETGLLVGSPQEMLDAVDMLAKNDTMREELVANAQQYVREERNGDVMRREWMEAIDA